MWRLVWHHIWVATHTLIGEEMQILLILAEECFFTFVGLTPYYVTAGWWGFDQPTDMSDLGVTSGRPLQTLWRDYMTQVQQDLPYRDFVQAEGVVARQYDPATGQLVSSGGATGYYTLDNLPTSLGDLSPVWGNA